MKALKMVMVNSIFGVLVKYTKKMNLLTKLMLKKLFLKLIIGIVALVLVDLF
jgi:hypothetical protein